MSGTAQRLPRLLALVPWLRTHPEVSVAAAAEAFAVTPRQLREDIELLFCCGLPGGSPGDLIDIDLEGETITLRDAQTLDRPLRLTADEGQMLLVAIRALADVPGLTDRNALDRAARKLETALTPAGDDQGNIGVDAPGTVAVALDAPGGGAELAALRQGVDENRRLHVQYLGANRDEITDRDVDPMRLLLRDGHWYLEGWCHRAEAVRLFRVDRILDARVLDVASTPPPFAVPRDLENGVFAPSNEHTLVVLDLDAGARWVADYHPVVSREELPGSRLRVGLRTPDLGWARSLVFRLGGRASVVQPPDLVQSVRGNAAAALAAYRGEDARDGRQS